MYIIYLYILISHIIFFHDSDAIKCDYILQSLYASIGDTKTLVNASHNNTNVSLINPYR